MQTQLKCVLLSLARLEMFLVLSWEHRMTDTVWEGDKKAEV